MRLRRPGSRSRPRPVALGGRHGLADVVPTRMYVMDRRDCDAVGRVHGGASRHPPVATMVSPGCDPHMRVEWSSRPGHRSRWPPGRRGPDAGCQRRTEAARGRPGPGASCPAPGSRTTAARPTPPGGRARGPRTGGGRAAVAAARLAGAHRRRAPEVDSPRRTVDTHGHGTGDADLPGRPARCRCSPASRRSRRGTPPPGRCRSRRPGRPGGGGRGLSRRRPGPGRPTCPGAAAEHAVGARAGARGSPRMRTRSWRRPRPGRRPSQSPVRRRGGQPPGSGVLASSWGCAPAWPPRTSRPWPPASASGSPPTASAGRGSTSSPSPSAKRSRGRRAQACGAGRCAWPPRRRRPEARRRAGTARRSRGPRPRTAAVRRGARDRWSAARGRSAGRRRTAVAPAATAAPSRRRGSPPRQGPAARGLRVAAGAHGVGPVRRLREVVDRCHSRTVPDLQVVAAFACIAACPQKIARPVSHLRVMVSGMPIGPYRRVLAVPSLRQVLLLGFLVRIPIFAGGVVLTLHVVPPSGVVCARPAWSPRRDRRDRRQRPWRGRLLDRRGLRRVVCPRSSSALLLVGRPVRRPTGRCWAWRRSRACSSSRPSRSSARPSSPRCPRRPPHRLSPGLGGGRAVVHGRPAPRGLGRHHLAHPLGAVRHRDARCRWPASCCGSPTRSPRRGGRAGRVRRPGSATGDGAAVPRSRVVRGTGSSPSASVPAAATTVVLGARHRDRGCPARLRRPAARSAGCWPCGASAPCSAAWSTAGCTGRSRRSGCSAGLALVSAPMALGRGRVLAGGAGLRRRAVLRADDHGDGRPGQPGGPGGRPRRGDGLARLVHDRGHGARRAAGRLRHRPRRLGRRLRRRRGGGPAPSR